MSYIYVDKANEEQSQRCSLSLILIPFFMDFLPFVCCCVSLLPKHNFLLQGLFIHGQVACSPLKLVSCALKWSSVHLLIDCCDIKWTSCEYFNTAHGLAVFLNSAVIFLIGCRISCNLKSWFFFLNRDIIKCCKHMTKTPLCAWFWLFLYSTVV